MWLNGWLAAYLLTQVIEVPVYLRTARTLPSSRRWLYAVGASTITHPLIWFALPWQSVSYMVLVLVAESFAFVAEALWGRALGAPRPWRSALLANAASVLLGGLIREGLCRLFS